RRLIVSVGVVAIKAAQQMSEDPRVPEKLRRALEDLRDRNQHVSPVAFWHGLAPELRGELTALGKPAGVGSIKQVQWAEHNSGERVLVAQVHPGLDATIAATATALRQVPEAASLVDRVVPMLSREIDLDSEAAAFERLRATALGRS